MEHKPEHTCFPIYTDCAGCAFELGEQLAKKKPTESAKYVWMVVGSNNPCDIRRYAFSYEDGVAQLAHVKGKYGDKWSGGVWTLFKLVRVSRTPKKGQKKLN